PREFNGVDDQKVDGNAPYTKGAGVVPGTDTSPSRRHTDLDVSVTNLNNDTVGFTFSATSGLVTTEAGGTATFTIKLNSQPTGTVTIPLSSNNTAEGTLSPASLTFSASNLNTPPPLTLPSSR